MYRGSSGVDPCLRIECSDLSLELARLRALTFSAVSGRLVSEAWSLCEDFEAIRFEKNDLDGSRACFDAVRLLAGEGGRSGIAVIRGEV